MKRLASFLITGSLVVVLGCNKPLTELDPATVTQIIIAHPNGGVGITDKLQIGTLISAMRNAKADSTLYDTAKVLTIEIQQGKTSLPRIPAGGPLFNVGKQQYYSKEFEALVTETLTKEKKHNSKKLSMCRSAH